VLERHADDAVASKAISQLNGQPTKAIGAKPLPPVADAAPPLSRPEIRRSFNEIGA